MVLGFSPAAEADLERIFAFNSARTLAWAEKVERRLQERARALLVTPELGRGTVRSGVKRLSVPDIQYVLEYRAHSGGIQILRIYSTREIR